MESLYSAHQLTDQDWKAFLQAGFVWSSDNQVFWGWDNLTKASEISNSEAGIFYSDFYLQSQEPWRWGSKCASDSVENFLVEISQNIELQSFRPQWMPADRALFMQDFHHIKMEIQQQNLEKAVPICFEWCSETPDDSQLGYSIQSGLRNKNKGQFLYGYWSNDAGLLGVSPEVLIKNQNNCYETAALAGTRSISKSQSLLNDSKEMKEHKIVVEKIGDVIQRAAVEAQVSETYEWEIGSLVHLKTDIQWESSLPLSSWVERLHPTPALGVASNKLDKSWLKNLNYGLERNAFGAPFGFHGLDGSTTFVVAIRNIQWQKGMTTLGSGCGIVEESELEREWNELFIKRKSVKELLSL